MQDVVSKSMALHTRYPGHDGHRPLLASPLGRIIQIVDEVPSCLTASVQSKSRPGHLYDFCKAAEG